MFDFFRRASPPYQTPLAMIGAKAGERVVFFGARDPGLAAAVAVVTGLNGQTSVIAPARSHVSLEAAAMKAGALLDLLPQDPDAPLDRVFDVAVWESDLAAIDKDQRQRRMSIMLRALRPGGRILILDGVAGRRRSGRGPSDVPPDEIVPLLTAAGAVVARALATVDGIVYYEARRPTIPT